MTQLYWSMQIQHVEHLPPRLQAKLMSKEAVWTLLWICGSSLLIIRLEALSMFFLSLTEKCYNVTDRALE